MGNHPDRVGGLRSIDQMKIVDPHTLEITYPDGMNRYSLRNFAAISLAVISKAACKKGADASDTWCAQWIRRNVMGSGPYMLGDYKNGEFMIVKANKNYWREVKPVLLGDHVPRRSRHPDPHAADAERRSRYRRADPEGIRNLGEGSQGRRLQRSALAGCGGHALEADDAALRRRQDPRGRDQGHSL